MTKKKYRFKCSDPTCTLRLILLLDFKVRCCVFIAVESSFFGPFFVVLKVKDVEKITKASIPYYQVALYIANVLVKQVRVFLCVDKYNIHLPLARMHSTCLALNPRASVCWLVFTPI